MGRQSKGLRVTVTGDAASIHFRFGIEHGRNGIGASVRLRYFLVQNGGVRHATDAIPVRPDGHG